MDEEYYKDNLNILCKKYYSNDTEFNRELKSISTDKRAGQIIYDMRVKLREREKQYKGLKERAAYKAQKDNYIYKEQLKHPLAIKFYNQHLNLLEYPFDSEKVVEHLYLFVIYEMEGRRLRETGSRGSKLYGEIRENLVFEDKRVKSKSEVSLEEIEKYFCKKKNKKKKISSINTTDTMSPPGPVIGGQHVRAEEEEKFDKLKVEIPSKPKPYLPPGIGHSLTPGLTILLTHANKATTINFISKNEFDVGGHGVKDNVLIGADHDLCRLNVNSLLTDPLQAQIVRHNSNYYIKCLAQNYITLYRVPRDRKYELEKYCYIYINESMQLLIEDIGFTRANIPWIDISEYYQGSMNAGGYFSERIFMNNEGEYIFGASQFADYPLPKAVGVSNKHFRIGYAKQSGWYLLDGSEAGPSKNGTYVALKMSNEFKTKAPSKPFRIYQGMEFKIADARLKVIIIIIYIYIYSLLNLQKKMIKI